jgi:hypothetical protein
VLPVRDILDTLLAAQRRSGFPDLGGTHAVATIPISDRLLNEFIARALPADGALRSVVLRAQDGDQFVLDLRVAMGPLALPVSLTVAIESQPEFPERPVLTLRLKNPGLLARAGSMLPMLSRLPPGIILNGDLIQIDLARVLRSFDPAEVRSYIKELRVTTRAGRIVLSVRGAIDPGSSITEVAEVHD